MINVGAFYQGEGKCNFTVWAPFAIKLVLEITSLKPQLLSMMKDEKGYWNVQAQGVFAGDRYFYQIDDNNKRPDPASFYQIEGVHNASTIVDHMSFLWDDGSFSRSPISEMIIYELHVGTFTKKGTLFDIIPKIKDLVHLGITTLELMPLAQFPGQRNWGYDGVYPFAVQNSYGGPDGLKELVNEAHVHGLSVIIDVVYNHLGPEGNYLGDYGPYFTQKYQTPWGDAVNFDGEYSFGVRDFFIQNALHWFEHYHIDGLRLDAVHGIFDSSAKHFLLELKQATAELNQRTRKDHFLIAESDLNDVRIISSPKQGGYGLDAQWLDDFHHSLHALITQEKQGYYADFGLVEHFKRAFYEGFVYQGEYSQFRKANHGNCSGDVSPDKFIVFSQNHDQVGNRSDGKRLSKLTSFEALKLSAAAVILSPYVPLLFMGQEYAEDAPFLYFIDHTDHDLIEAVRKGRKEEFKAFNQQQDVPDPKSEETFLNSKLDWSKQAKDKHKVILSFYKELIKIRKTSMVFSHFDRNAQDVSIVENEKVIFWRRWYNRNELFCVMNFSENRVECKAMISSGKWKKLIDSTDEIWNGSGNIMPQFINTEQLLQISACSFALYEKEVLR